MTTYSPDLQQFVQEQLATGEFQDEAELMQQALTVYRELRTRHNHLRADIESAIAQADRGKVAPLDIDAIKAELTAELDETGQPI